MNFISILWVVICAGVILFILCEADEDPEGIDGIDVFVFLWCVMKILEVICC